MRKNFALRLGVLTLIMTIISISLASGTYAKYVKQVSGSETVRVSKFAFNLFDGTNTLTEQTLTGDYDIFSYTDSGVYANGVNGDKFIAPGTTGEIDLEVQNLSEVKVAATFALTETNNGALTPKIPIYYTYGADTQRYSTVLTGGYTGGGTYKTIAELATAMATAGTAIDASDGTAPESVPYVLHWTWAFATAGTQQTDANDTALGISYTTPPEITLAIATTVTQID